MSGSGSAPVLPVAESPRDEASIAARSERRFRSGRDVGAEKNVEDAATVARRYIEPVREKGTSEAVEGSS